MDVRKVPGKQIDISSIFKQTDITNFPLQIHNFWQNVNFWKSVNSKHFQPTTCLKRSYLNWGRTMRPQFFWDVSCHSNLKSSYGCSSCIYSHFIILRGRHLSSLHSARIRKFEKWLWVDDSERFLANKGDELARHFQQTRELRMRGRRRIARH